MGSTPTASRGTMARKKAPSPAEPVRPTRREVPPPTWYADRRVFAHTSMLSLRSVLGEKQVWTLPPFQREVVWSAEQQAAFCNTLIQGQPSASLLVWDRYVQGVGNVALVLDGQQRLTALGANVQRADGTRNPRPQAFFDPATGWFTPNPGRWSMTAKDIASYDFCGYIDRLDALEREDPAGYDLWHHMIYARDMVGDKQMAFYILDSHATPEFVVAAFRAINMPGVPFAPEEVERLVQVAADFK